VLLGKTEWEKPLFRPRRIWEDNVKKVVQEVGCEFMNWIEMALDRDNWRALVNAVMNTWVPQIAGNYLTT
jgi:pyruvate formate-lyase activating enzyme-like uncharacterized protein